jgi:23S rRNA pseudouridine1911/1915/1917 synthase
VSDRQWTVGAREAGSRLDKFLAALDRLGSRSKATTAIDRGKVFVNDRETGTADAALALSAGDVVRVWMDRPGSGRVVRARTRRDGDLIVVYEDASLLVVDKPPGLLAVPLSRRGHVSSLVELVQEHLRSQGKRQPQVVHRIDRDTSGLVMFAKDRATLAHLKGQFLRREPERIYQAIVHGHPMPAAGLWYDRLIWDDEDLIQRAATAGDSRGKEARSEYRVLQRLHGASLIEVRLVTGKRNQIRLQAELRGHPLVGETMYADAPRTDRIAFPRQALHAWRLAFEHPVTGHQVRLESPLPSDMAKLLARLSARRHPPGRRSIRQEPE